MSTMTTHVLDASLGQQAADAAVRSERLEGAGLSPVGQERADDDGQLAAPRALLATRPEV